MAPPTKEQKLINEIQNLVAELGDHPPMREIRNFINKVRAIITGIEQTPREVVEEPDAADEPEEPTTSETEADAETEEV